MAATVVDDVRGRPGGDRPWTGAAHGEGSPQPFDLGYGFVKRGDVKWRGEELMYLDLEPRGGRP